MAASLQTAVPQPGALVDPENLHLSLNLPRLWACGRNWLRKRSGTPRYLLSSKAGGCFLACFLASHCRAPGLITCCVTGLTSLPPCT